MQPFFLFLFFSFSFLFPFIFIVVFNRDVAVGTGRSCDVHCICVNGEFEVCFRLTRPTAFGPLIGQPQPPDGEKAF
jgi:hypothetical protein